MTQAPATLLELSTLYPSLSSLSMTPLFPNCKIWGGTCRNRDVEEGEGPLPLANQLHWGGVSTA